MRSNLEHHAAGHALRRIAPVALLELAKPVTADIGFRLNEESQLAGVYLFLYPTEMGFTAALESDGKPYICIPANARDLQTFSHCIGDRFVKEYVLPRLRRLPSSVQMDIVGGGVDYTVDFGIRENFFIARCRVTVVFFCKILALVSRACEAGSNLDTFCTTDGVRQLIRPPAQSQ